MRAPWRCPASLSAREYGALRAHVIFDCGKLDPQCEDVEVIARYPVVLGPVEWEHLAACAEQLAAEALAAEAELLARPGLHRPLGLPRRIAAALRNSPPPARAAPRCLRFDFHLTPEGWRISEVNSDVPGGFIEAAGLGRAMAERYPGCAPAGDPGAALVVAVLRHSGGREIGLVHATAYTDDRQVMTHLARHFTGAGANAHLLAPDQLAWARGRAAAVRRGAPLPLDALVRFYPAEWLPNLARSAEWRRFFDARTPQTNPPSSLLTQSKRFPLVWDRLGTPMEAWRALLPETRDPRAVDRRAAEEWVYKPALGRVGEGIGIRGVVGDRDWRRIRRAARRRPSWWVAQRRFEALHIDTPEGPRYPCIGVFVIDGAACGAYGRIAPRPLIDARSQDIAVLVETRDATQAHREHTHGRTAAAV
ncbi:MAG TPA: glutathionylspermidine synthase family protein [Phycisphaerales bacterium]|nr:glutathionylspermidine synthase family protein [Phycisphaerales bacterium]